MASLAIMDRGRFRSCMQLVQNRTYVCREMSKCTSIPKPPLLVFLLSSSSVGRKPPAESVLLRGGMGEKAGVSRLVAVNHRIAAECWLIYYRRMSSGVLNGAGCRQLEMCVVEFCWQTRLTRHAIPETRVQVVSKPACGDVPVFSDIDIFIFMQCTFYSSSSSSWLLCNMHPYGITRMICLVQPNGA